MYEKFVKKKKIRIRKERNFFKRVQIAQKIVIEIT